MVPEPESLESIQLHQVNDWIDINVLIKVFETRDSDVLRNGFPKHTDLLKALHTNIENGIDDDSIPERERMYGRNVLPPPIMKPFLKFLYLAMKERMVVLLIIAATITIAVGLYETLSGVQNAWLEGVAILIAIGVITGVQSINDYRKQARFRKLSDTNKSLRTVKILRNGQILQIPTKDLVVGDIATVSMGDIMSCDGILITNNDIRTDESTLTGESRQIRKAGYKDLTNDIYDTTDEHEHGDKKDPFMISGTTIVNGNGKVLVLLVGEMSTEGKLMKDVSVDPPSTPLQIKLNKLAKRLATIGFVIAGLILTILVIIYFLKGSPGRILKGLTAVILIGISIIVMAIPEGLPLAVTLALAYATIHMLKENNLVRHLNACETMGSATTVCSDKTGTLTINKMSVVKAKVFDINYDLDTNVQETATKIKQNPFYRYLLEGIMINTDAYEAEVGGKVKFLGSQTEIGLLEWLRLIDPLKNYNDIRKEASIVCQSPFNSENKMSSIKVRKDSENITYIKGASEVILSLCDRFIDGTELQPLDDTNRSMFADMIEEFARKSLRTICCAYSYDKTYHTGDNQNDNGQSDTRNNDDGQSATRNNDDGQSATRNNDDGQSATRNNDNGYILCALFGLEDPLRPSAFQSVKQCQRAGIIVRMVTGDNLITAKSIAEQCGILQSENDIIIEGPEFRKLSPESLRTIVPNLRVMARSSPNDKLMLVNTLIEMNETVAVTGDGANDAPALKSSHVGFSMGVSGTEVAKEASDIVLLDDNFSSIVRALLWGRAIYMGIQKFITFQLSVNISAVLITVITALDTSIRTGIPKGALTTLQILLLNLIADSLAALALSTDKPVDSYLDHEPHRQSDKIITGDMWRMIIGQSIFQISVSLLVYYVGPSFFGSDSSVRGTMVYATFVFMVIFNELNCRSVDRDLNIFRGIFKNKFFLPLFIISMISQFFIVTYLGVIFDTVPLDWSLWLVAISIGTGSLLVGVAIRLIDRLFPHK